MPGIKPICTGKQRLCCRSFWQGCESIMRFWSVTVTADRLPCWRRPPTPKRWPGSSRKPPMCSWNRLRGRASVKPSRPMNHGALKNAWPVTMVIEREDSFAPGPTPGCRLPFGTGTLKILLDGFNVRLWLSRASRIDTVLARQVEAIVAGIGPCATALLIPGCGHIPHRDAPGRVRRAIAEFAASPLMMQRLRTVFV